MLKPQAVALLLGDLKRKGQANIRPLQATLSTRQGVKRPPCSLKLRRVRAAPRTIRQDLIQSLYGCCLVLVDKPVYLGVSVGHASHQFWSHRTLSETDLTNSQLTLILPVLVQFAPFSHIHSHIQPRKTQKTYQNSQFKKLCSKKFHRYHPHYLRNVVKDPCPSVQANPKWANSAQTMSMNSLNSVKINIKRSHQLGEAECVSNLLFLECKYMHHDFSWAIINENRITCRSC